jgi:hypothetical protein
VVFKRAKVAGESFKHSGDFAGISDKVVAYEVEALSGQSYVAGICGCGATP